MSTIAPIPRRTVLRAAAGAALPLVHIRTAGAAGRLVVLFFDHFVPGANDALRRLVGQWAETTRTEVQLDFIDIFGDRAGMIASEEALAQTGHDIVPLWYWDVATHADKLEPVGDVVAPLVARYGAVSPALEYLARIEGSWRAVPTYWTNTSGPCCSRIDILSQFAGLDVQGLFPAAEAMGVGYEKWDWNAFLAAAAACAKAGYPFGWSMGNAAKADHFTGILFRSFGAVLVDAEGRITVNSDNTRAVLDYARRLMEVIPVACYAWDNTSNLRALVAGRTGLILNAPSAWFAAVRDNPAVGSQCWTHPTPAGPAGRFVPYIPNFWAVWRFARNKSAAKELLAWLSERDQADQLCSAGRGYDLPAFPDMVNFSVWAEAAPPRGTLYNYPVRPAHHAELNVAGQPAPHAIASRIANDHIMPRMVAKVAHDGETPERTIAWAERELEGFMR